MSEELLIKHCSPTLAGIKTGNLFLTKFDRKKELWDQIQRLNRIFKRKGLKLLPVKLMNNKALLYLYRPSALKKDLTNSIASKILEEKGYNTCSINKCINKLISRIYSTNNDFPHEIGLFLGYPPEDVLGFINNNASGFKCQGVWKVYGNEDKAKECFCKYKKCTKCYLEMFNLGWSIEQLTVAGL